MAERRFLDIRESGAVEPLDAEGKALLSERAGRYWLHDSHPELIFLSYAGLDALDGEAPPERAVVTADLTGLNALEIFGMIAQSRLTIRVVAVRDGVERVLLFRDGEIASIASNDARDRIGNYLVRLGLLARETLEVVLQAAPPTGRRVGQLLVESGVLSSHELWKAIQQQVMELFCEVSMWDRGHVVGYLLPPGFSFPPTPTMGTQGLLMEAVRRADEMSLIRAKIPDDNVLLEATGKKSELTEDGQQAVLALNQPRSVGQLAQVLHRTEFDLLRLLYSLVQAGVLRVVRPSAGSGFQRPEGTRASQVLEVFNMALNEIVEEVDKAAATERFRGGVNGFLADPKGSMAAVFAGVQLADDTTLPEVQLMANAAAQLDHDPAQILSDALNELLFFCLFQCGELLESSVDEDLARRVRMIYAMLDEE